MKKMIYVISAILFAAFLTASIVVIKNHTLSNDPVVKYDGDNAPVIRGK